ncbi:MAG TPA: HD domain-containing phosphohydrolase [Rhodocyclaceae bacterium]|nr:HD domain-containing phosphohydrolase [Rhodocyclaceae bacterium]
MVQRISIGKGQMAYRISAGAIHVGEPVSQDILDADGVLLLRRGSRIDSQRVLDRLFEDGLFIKDLGEGVGADKRILPTEKSNALQLLLDARRLFNRAITNPKAELVFPVHIGRVAELVDQACETNADVSIATILLLQDISYAARHHINTAVICNLLCKAMSMPDHEARTITAAALTMNIGMYEVQDKLNEIKGELNPKLRGLIAAHPEQSVLRLKKLGVEDPVWLRCVEQHHECEDGSGYPNGLIGVAIEPGARVIALADRYCAQVSSRSYRAARAPGLALKALLEQQGEQINASVAAHLRRIVGLYPPGTIVRLKNNEVAVVKTPSPRNPDTPTAFAMISPKGEPLTEPLPRRTAMSDYKITDVLTIETIDFPIQMSRLWGDEASLAY